MSLHPLNLFMLEMNSQKAIAPCSTLSSSSLDELPKEKWWWGMDLHKYQGFWYFLHSLQAALAAQSQFQAREDDVILASSMKTGTTWLKAIIPTIFSVTDRHQPADDDPLITNHPNELMPSLEIQVFRQDSDPDKYLSCTTTTPRLFRTLVPYHMLSESVQSSGCKIVYITRDPNDVIVSMFHFFNSIQRYKEEEPILIDELFEPFCKGAHPFGPFHDHVLGYWKEALERPEKILFLRYEDMKRDPRGEVRRLASFVGRPLEREEDVDKVLWRCSLERIKNLEVNVNGVDPWIDVPYRSYFRLGTVGDWRNHLSPEMKERLSEITRAKMEGSGLSFETT